MWGGRSKARVIIDMISEIYSTKAEIIGVFDKTLDELPFDTNINIILKNMNLNCCVRLPPIS